MIFIFYTNLALEFIALAAGTMLFSWALQNKGDGSAIATFIGLLILIFSFIATVFTLISGGKAWMAGNMAVFEAPQISIQMKGKDQEEQMKDKIKNKIKANKRD